MDLSTVRGLRFVWGYHRGDNFTGRSVPGYEAPGSWAHPAVATALTGAIEDLAPRGLALLVYDAYRPQRASEAMARWCEGSGHAHLLDGWVARRSRHNAGVAVDVALARARDGAPLAMGGAWDDFDSGSHAAVATGVARVHRRVLAEAMAARGFEPYWREWWHFELPVPGAVSLDVPYG